MKEVFEPGEENSLSREFGGKPEELYHEAEEFQRPGEEVYTSVTSEEKKDSKTASRGRMKKMLRNMSYLVAASVASVVVLTSMNHTTVSSGEQLSDYDTAVVCDAQDRTAVSASIVVYTSSGTRAGSAKSGSDGSYDLTLKSGEYVAEVSASGYQTARLTFTQYETGKVNQVFALTAKLKKGQMRIVLQWGENPSDLDSHLTSDTYGIHVYYGDTYGVSPEDNNTVIAWLDVDDTSSYGPETVTLNTTKGDFEYYIYRYAGHGTVAASGATVQVYTYGKSKPQEFKVPANGGGGNYWRVFSIHNGKITVINEITDSIYN